MSFSGVTGASDIMVLPFLFVKYLSHSFFVTFFLDSYSFELTIGSTGVLNMPCSTKYRTRKLNRLISGNMAEIMS